MVNTAVGFRLLTEPGAIDDVRGTIELFTWKDSEPPAPAEVLDIGKARVLETKRARLASAGLRDEGDVMTESLECSPNEEFCSQCENMRRELDVVKRRNEDLEAAHESQKVLKKLKKMLDDMKSIDAISAVRPCPQIDIGGGVLIEETALEKLRSSCPGAPAKFARGLMRQLFTADELRGKSLFGRKSNSHPDASLREALDPVRVNAIIGFTIREFKADPIRLKSSLSSLLSQEIK
ncbi:uncharacterized protein LOC144106531 [Amblyomma americanum]